MRIALALAALAATSLYVALKVNEDVINEAIRDALDSAEVEGGVPPEAYEWAPRMAFVVPPVAVFSFVFIVTSLVACLCSCGDKPPRAVAVGRPLGPGQTIALNIWSDGLCSCCNDVGLCCSAICLPCVPLAQLYERVYGARHSCTMIAGAFALASLLVTSTSSVCKTSVECTTHVDAYGHSVPSCVASSPLDAPAICDYVEGLSTFTTFVRRPLAIPGCSLLCCWRDLAAVLLAGPGCCASMAFHYLRLADAPCVLPWPSMTFALPTPLVCAAAHRRPHARARARPCALRHRPLLLRAARRLLLRLLLPALRHLPVSAPP